MKKVWEIAPETQARVVNLLYDHYQDFRLLLCRAEGTHHANFIHDFTDHVTDRTMTFVREAYQKGISSTLLAFLVPNLSTIRPTKSCTKA